MHQSILSLPPPPRDSHILVAPAVGFSFLCLARGFFLGGGGSNQSKSSISFEKSAIFALSLRQMSNSFFHMFIYARSKQCDLRPIYTITNTQSIRIYPGINWNPSWSKFNLIQDVNMAKKCQRKPNSIPDYWEFIRTPLFTRVQIPSVFRFDQLCCKFTRLN